MGIISVHFSTALLHNLSQKEGLPKTSWLTSCADKRYNFVGPRNDEQKDYRRVASVFRIHMLEHGYNQRHPSIKRSPSLPVAFPREVFKST